MNHLRVFAFILALCTGCVSLRRDPVPGIDAFCGDWTVKHLPPGKMAIEYAMEGVELPPSDAGGSFPFGGTLHIERQGDRLRYGDHIAEVHLVMGGFNDEVPHVYAVGREDTEFGADVSVLYLGNDGKIFGTWSAMFWGLNTALPPITNSAAFVLERKGEVNQ